MTGTCALGIDVGSTTAKIVAVDADGLLAWSHLETAEPQVEAQVRRLVEHARQATGASEQVPLVATGYGRKLVHLATQTVTEITCHARGIYAELGLGGVLIDIGGQDSKVIRLRPTGEVVDFGMNDKCAAGTGRFLENTAARMGVPIAHLGETALASPDEVPVTSTCTVFAESEVVSLLAQGCALGAVLKGLHRALVQRIVAMVRSIGLVSPLMLSGGVAHNPAVCALLEEETGSQVILSGRPQLVGAYGAALTALEMRPGAR